MSLDLPPIIAPQQSVALPSLRENVLAQFKAVEPGLVALAERYRKVAFNVSTPSGMAEACKARNELRESGRYMVQRARDRIKKEANDLKTLVVDEADRLIAIVGPIEEAVHAQIVAEEERAAAAAAEVARLAAEAAAAEAARVQAHRTNIATIQSYVGQAAGRSSEEIAQAIMNLRSISLGAEWEEFLEEAQAAAAHALDALNDLLEKATQAERDAAELAQLRREKAERDAVERAAADAAAAERVAREERELAERLVTGTTWSRGGERIDPKDVLLGAEIGGSGSTPVTDLAARGAEATVVTIARHGEPERVVGVFPVGGARVHNLQDHRTPKESGSVAETSGAYASSEAQAAQASPSGCEGEGAHAEERAPEPATLALGVLCQRVGQGFHVTEAFLNRIGIHADNSERRAVLFFPSRHREICMKIAARLMIVANETHGDKQ